MDSLQKESIEINERTASIRALWCASSEGHLKQALSSVLDVPDRSLDEKRHAANELASQMAKGLTVPHFSPALKTWVDEFARHWIWG